MKYIYQVSGMKCASCISKIKNALKDFAESIEVTLQPPRMILEGKDSSNWKKLNKVLQAVGSYQITPLNEASTTILNPSIQEKNWLKTYSPLLLIVAMISISSFAGASNLHQWMMHFMAGFFLVFGGFKLLDLEGFRDAYATYDLLAQKWKGYGYIYPFLELAIGFSFLFQFALVPVLWFSLLLMGFSSLGVAKAVLEKKKIRCACLGTTLNLPMTSITLVEDLVMVAMALVMLM